MSNEHAADLAEIRQLASRYGIAFDTRDRAAFDQLWTSGGTLEAFQDGPGRPASGTLRLGQFHHAFDRLTAYRSTQHHVTTHVAEVHGDTANCVAYCEAHHVDDGGTDLVMHIRYVDTYRRDPGEDWRFANRRVEVLITETRSVRLLG